MDWADPQEEPDEQTMSKVKVLYVRNLTQDTSEEKLKVSAARFTGRRIIDSNALFCLFVVHRKVSNSLAKLNE